MNQLNIRKCLTKNLTSPLVGQSFCISKTFASLLRTQKLCPTRTKFFLLLPLFFRMEKLRSEGFSVRKNNGSFVLRGQSSSFCSCAKARGTKGKAESEQIAQKLCVFFVQEVQEVQGKRYNNFQKIYVLNFKPFTSFNNKFCA